MDVVSQWALAAGLAWASGFRLYAAVFVVGMLGRHGVIALPEALAIVEHPWVLVASGIMLGGEFLADKIPAFDSVWDAVNTFVRIPAGAFLAWGAMGDATPAAQFSAALVGGFITSGTHIFKTGGRALINSSPEPLSNWTASFSEDGLVLLGFGSRSSTRGSSSSCSCCSWPSWCGCCRNCSACLRASCVACAGRGPQAMGMGWRVDDAQGSDQPA